MSRRRHRPSSSPSISLPDTDGITFPSRVRSVAPGSVRVLCTASRDFHVGPGGREFGRGRVALYSRHLAQELGVGDPEFTVVEQAAILHDIGKIGVRDQVLLGTT